MQTQNAPFPLQQIIDEFGFEGEYIGYRVSNDGHINNTFVLDFKNADGSSTSYLVQLINTNVFKNPDELMENIVGVTGYLRNIVIERGMPQGVLHKGWQALFQNRERRMLAMLQFHHRRARLPVH